MVCTVDCETFCSFIRTNSTSLPRHLSTSLNLSKELKETVAKVGHCGQQKITFNLACGYCVVLLFIQLSLYNNNYNYSLICTTELAFGYTVQNNFQCKKFPIPDFNVNCHRLSSSPVVYKWHLSQVTPAFAQVSSVLYKSSSFLVHLSFLSSFQ